MAEEEIQQIEAEETPPVEDGQGTGDGRVRYEIDGEIYEGTPAEVADKLYHGKKASNDYIRQLKGNLETFQRLTEEHGLGKKTAEESKEKFNANDFFGVLATDPEKAYDMMLTRAFGAPPKKIAETLEAITSQMQNLNQAHSVAQFYRNAGIDQDLGQDQAELILRKIQQDGLTHDANGMELAYHRLVKQGVIQPRSKEATERTKPPPRLQGTSERSSTGESPEEMDIEKLEALIKKQFGSLTG